MKFLSLKGSELDRLDFEPTLVIGFYRSNRVEIFKEEYEYLSKRFKSCDIVGCSANSVIVDELPYVDLYNENSTVYLCLDIEKEAFNISLMSEDEYISYDNSYQQDIIILSSYSSRELESKIDSLSEVGSVNNIVGAVASLSEDDIESNQAIFVNGRFYQNSLLAISIKNNFYKLKVYSINFFSPVGLPMKITKSRNNTILELDEQPALEAIESLAGRLNDEIISKFGYPLFLSSEQETEWESRPLASMVGIDRKAQSITLYREIKEGEYIELGIMVSKEEQLDRLKSIYEDVCDNRISLLFNCIAIPANLGIMEYQYLYHLKKNRNITFSGFHTFGEIGPACPKCRKFLLHNQSVTMAFICEANRSKDAI